MVLKSTKVKYFGITGTIFLITLSYTLSASTFYSELHPQKSESPVCKKVTEKIEKLDAKPKNVAQLPQLTLKSEPKALQTPKKSPPAQPSANEQIEALLKGNRYIRFNESGEIEATSKDLLKKLTPLFASIDDAYIEIEGYSISLDSKEKAQERSLAYAKKVYSYLDKKDIDKKLELTSYGDSYPISDNKYDDRNSRVEIKIRRR